MKKLIQATGLIKKYNGQVVVEKIDFEINEGEMIALIGTNGAGKTTTISMLLGIIKPDSGTINYWTEEFKSHVGVQLQTTPFFEGYSVLENMMIFAVLHNIPFTKSMAVERLKDMGLKNMEKTPAIRLSLGQQKRLAIALATIHKPKLIILDEPTSGLDPRARQEIRLLLKQLLKENATIMFSSHDMEEVSKLATRVVIMDKGRIIANGTPNDLMREQQVNSLEELYLTLTEENKDENIISNYS